MSTAKYINEPYIPRFKTAYDELPLDVETNSGEIKTVPNLADTTATLITKYSQGIIQPKLAHYQTSPSFETVDPTQHPTFGLHSLGEYKESLEKLNEHKTAYLQKTKDKVKHKQQQTQVETDDKHKLNDETQNNE